MLIDTNRLTVDFELGPYSSFEGVVSYFDMVQRKEDKENMMGGCTEKKQMDDLTCIRENN
jgi:hypothetical protein